MKQIGFIGVGIMGKPMVRNLMKAGFQVCIYARHPEKVRDVVTEGAELCSSIAECVKKSQAVITMVGFPQDVESVYFAPDNILDSAAEGTYLIDMTTTSPKLAEKIYEEGSRRGLHVLDAPVTGGEGGAIRGVLSILAGGDQPDFEACTPVFQAMGTNINYQGPAGSGQHCKMVNQIMIAGTISGICEAFAYMKAKGLDPDTVMRSVATGAAGSHQLDSNGKKILEGDEAPGFFIKHFIKDMRLAQQEARDSNLDLEILGDTLRHYEHLEAQGLGDLGTQALQRYYP